MIFTMENNKVVDAQVFLNFCKMARHSELESAYPNALDILNSFPSAQNSNNACRQFGLLSRAAKPRAVIFDRLTPLLHQTIWLSYRLLPLRTLHGLSNRIVPLLSVGQNMLFLFLFLF